MVATIRSKKTKKVDSQVQKIAKEIKSFLNKKNTVISEEVLRENIARDMQDGTKLESALDWGVETQLFKSFGSKRYGQINLSEVEVRSADLARFNSGDLVLNRGINKAGQFVEAATSDIPTAFVRYEGMSFPELANPSDLDLLPEPKSELVEPAEKTQSPKTEADFGLVPGVTRIKIKSGRYAGEQGTYQYGFFGEGQAQPQCWVLLDNEIGLRTEIAFLEIEKNKPATTATILEQLKELPKLKPEEISRQLELPLDFSGKDLEKKEVLDLIKQINGMQALLPEIVKFSNNLTRYALVKIDLREGNKAFGCETFSSFLRNHSDLFHKPYSCLQKEWQAGRLETQVLGLKIGTLPENQARELYPLKEDLEQCRKAYQTAVETAQSKKVKLTAKLIREVVNKMIDKEVKPEVKTNCGWVCGNQGSRHYRIKIADYRLDLQDTYQDVAVSLEELSKEKSKSPESLLIESMIEIISRQGDTTHAGAIKSIVKFAENM